MKDTKMTEFASKSIAELENLVAQERAALYKARRDLVFRQITDTASVKVRRHNIARMLTAISQKMKADSK